MLMKLRVGSVLNPITSKGLVDRESKLVVCKLPYSRNKNTTLGYHRAKQILPNGDMSWWDVIIDKTEYKRVKY